MKRLASVLVVALVFLGCSAQAGAPTAPATPVATASPSPSPTTTPTATAAPTPTATPKPTATPAPSACDPAKLAARITRWEGAAGSRIADLELTNANSETCTIRAMDKPQLVDGKGSVLINGQTPTGAAVVTLAPGDVVTTLVEDSNYCGPDPLPPVSVAFVQSGGGRFVATPVSPTDTTVPPCNGAGQPAVIDMHAWAH